MPILSLRGSALVTTGLLSLTLLGAGCGGSRAMIDTDTDTINVPTGNGGTFSAGESAQIPANFPSFFPQYPNAKTTLAFTENNGRTGSLVQQTSDSYTQAQTWIEGNFQSQGFTKENTLSSPNLVILSFTKGTTRCQVNIAQQDAVTQVQTTCVEQ